MTTQSGQAERLPPCPLSEERLGLFLLGELDGEEAAQMGRHLTTCATCLREEAALRALFGEVRGGPPVRGAEQDERFFQTMRAGVLSELERRRRWGRRVPLALSAAAALLLLWAGQSGWPGRGPSVEQRPAPSGLAAAPAGPGLAPGEATALEEPIWEEDALYLDPDPAAMIDELDREELVQLDRGMKAGAGT